jgi:hypothetical protein
MSQSRAILAIAVCIALGLIVVSLLSHDDLIVATDEGRPHPAAETSAESQANSTLSMTQSGLSQSSSTTRVSRSITKDKLPSFESEMVIGGAIRSGQVVTPDAAATTFPRLVDEFRAGDLSKADVRQRFSDFFLSQPEFLSSELNLELLECGLVLCVAELRSSDSATLSTFTRDINNRDGYEAKATQEFPSSQPNVARLIFSHDPKINGITLPQ